MLVNFQLLTCVGLRMVAQCTSIFKYHVLSISSQDASTDGAALAGGQLDNTIQAESAHYFSHGVDSLIMSRLVYIYIIYLPYFRCV